MSPIFSGRALLKPIAFSWRYSKMESIPTVIKSLQPIAFGSNQHVSYSITRHLLKLRLDKLKFHFSIWLYGQVKTHLIKSTHFYITVLKWFNNPPIYWNKKISQPDWWSFYRSISNFSTVWTNCFLYDECIHEWL